METFLEILKWIGIALAAGFVGYFGRYPAKVLIKRITGNTQSVSEKVPEGERDNGQTALMKSRQKIEKKKAKQAAKLVKKADK